jgi:hypothetical protein
MVGNCGTQEMKHAGTVVAGKLQVVIYLWKESSGNLHPGSVTGVDVLQTVLFSKSTLLLRFSSSFNLRSDTFRHGRGIRATCPFAPCLSIHIYEN